MIFWKFWNEIPDRDTQFQSHIVWGYKVPRPSFTLLKNEGFNDFPSLDIKNFVLPMISLKSHILTSLSILL